MNRLRDILPKHLTEKKFLFRTVLYITIFSIIFMNIYSPYSTTAWFSFHDKKEVTGMLSFYLISVFLLLASKLLFYKINSRKLMSYAGSILFILLEIVLITAVYLLFTKLFIDLSGIETKVILFRAYACVTLILVLPYTICALYFTVKHQNRLLKTGISRSNIQKKNHLVNLCDKRGKIKLSISSEDLLYVASEDNYVKIFYEQGEKVISYMLRSTTKNIEDSFGKNLVRCHRSYLVNINKIKLFNNERDNMFITLKNSLVNPLPVSRSYRENVETLLENESKNSADNC